MVKAFPNWGLKHDGCAACSTRAVVRYVALSLRVTQRGHEQGSALISDPTTDRVGLGAESPTSPGGERVCRLLLPLPRHPDIP
eukprot:2690888-Pleurochrysis_carterae.AAC.3